MSENAIKLTQFSHGAGCGCKLSPAVLNEIVQKVSADQNLIVGNNNSDDAVVYDNGDGTAIISTTDFFTAIVDDPFDFGRIAATNAISDVYAMGGTPIVAIAILGWPIDKLPPALAAEVMKGASEVCSAAGISLAGGHSIDIPEPVFGLAVTGKVAIVDLKKNDTAQSKAKIYLTKALGVGILSTAQKKGLATATDLQNAINSMTQLNDIGETMGKLPYVQAMTDVTGFGLLGHLTEMCQGSGLSARIQSGRVPVLPNVQSYIDKNCIPGGTRRNFDSYGQHVQVKEDLIPLMADPQTSGGLLVAVEEGQEETFEAFMAKRGMHLKSIGSFESRGEALVIVE